MKNSFLALLVYVCSMTTTLPSLAFEAVSPDTLLKLQSEGALIVDIRRAKEWQQTGVIKGSKLHTFYDKQRRFDLEDWEQKISHYIKDKNNPIVLVCRAANRTKSLAYILQKEGYTNLYELQQGIVYGWQDKGYPTTHTPTY